MLVDVLHLYMVGETDVEPCSDILCTQHIVEIGDGSEVLRHQPPVELVESVHPLVLAIDVGLHEEEVRREVLKERPRKGTAEDRKSHIRVLLCRRHHYWHGHGHIAYCRQSYYENVLGHFLYNTGLVAGSLYIFICL